ncbi:MAG: Ig-like domain-containing protein, partial [Caldilineaceae bacterium]|nr:Ig-like domain-containing protein [Caldilineaceae bacterium]
YTAESDALTFGVPSVGAHQFAVTGFSSADVSLFDITNPAQPVQVTGAETAASGGAFRLRFEENADADARYVALTPAQYRTPVSQEVDTASSWRSAQNGADYIIITHEDFYDTVQTLAQYRQTQGLRTAVVKIGDVYDEFSGGVFTPAAIRSFLRYAYTSWAAPAPSYVLLVGDAFQNFKDTVKSGTINYVPSQLVETDLLGETVSDNWFAAVSGDDLLPDMMIGRLAVQSAQQAQAQIDKILAYEQNAPGAAWTSNVLLVADDDESTFRFVAEQVAERIPFGYTLNRVYVEDYPPNDPTTAIQAQINEGALFVNYAGHGEYYRWGKWDNESAFILDLDDIAALQNDGKLPVVTVANCLNGYFAGPKQQASLAEAFMDQSAGGAVAVWAPTGLGAPFSHYVLLNAFYDAVYQKDLHVLGAATTTAKLTAYTESPLLGELVQIYTLLGDPATKLAAPTNAPYVEETYPTHAAVDIPVDAPVEILFSKPISAGSVVVGSSDPSLTLSQPEWLSDDRLLRVPTPGLAHGQTYTLTVAATDLAGNALRSGPAPQTWSFTVTADDVAPQASLTVRGDSAAAPLTTTV